MLAIILFVRYTLVSFAAGTAVPLSAVFITKAGLTVSSLAFVTAYLAKGREDG